MTETSYAKVAISEVMWAGSNLSTADEWLEITAIGTGSSLSGWSLHVRSTSGELKTQFIFPAKTSIDSGQFMVIANYAASQSVLSNEPDFVTTKLSLPNSKLLIQLRNASGAIIDTVDDGIGKPMAGENSSTEPKRSMERVDLHGSGSLKSNWISATASVGFDSGAHIFGTPGTGLILGVPPVPTSPPVESGATVSSGTWSPVVISEVLANPIGKDDTEWIELANRGTGAVHLSGWQLRGSAKSERFIIQDEHVCHAERQRGTLIAFADAQADNQPCTSSGFFLHPGEHLSFRKTLTGIGLTNKGETVSLWSGSLLMDELMYPETAEHVSYGRVGSGTQALCTPSEGKPNDPTVTIDPFISIQSGQPEGINKVTVNLQAALASGSLKGSQCSWDYGNGFTSDSCNPPSHTFKTVGQYSVVLTLTTFCQQSVERTVAVSVIAPSGNKKKPQSPSNPEPEPEPECSITHSSAIRISEVLPNPYGEEKDEEWIELYNAGSEAVSLCGWTLDDSEEGSKPYPLDEYEIAGGEYLLVPRSNSKLALNNANDEARLFAGNTLVSSVSYAKALEGEVMAWRDDGLYVWTPYATPGEGNKFRTAERRFASDRLIVSAALPNPTGKDAGQEWIEIANVTDELITLDDWKLDNKPGSSQPLELHGTLEPGAIKRYTEVALVNTSDQARLLDPDGYVASLLSWTEAIDGKIYRPPVFQGTRMQARVTNVVDGDTIDIELVDTDEFTGVPDELKRRWLGLSTQGQPKLRVRLIGIDTPETVHPSMPVQQYGNEASKLVRSQLLNQTVELEFDRELFDKYQRVLAYVYLDKEMIQAELLRRGLAYTYTRFPFLRTDEFLAYEAEALQGKLGLWSSSEAEQMIELTKQDVDTTVMLETMGLNLVASPQPGLVSSGTVVELQPSVESEVYIAKGTEDFRLLSGSVVIYSDTNLIAYAMRANGTGTIMSDVLSLSYTIEKESYTKEVEISEVYPAPVGTGTALHHALGDLATEEWIELRNLTNHPVNLAGWQLADATSSKTLGPDAVVPGSGRLIINNQQLGISLNNDGDEVRLVSPDSEVEIVVEYENVKKGESVIGDCHTDIPTPYEQNICTKIDKNLDTDGDFLADKYEQHFYTTNPENPDTDGDTWLDGFEVMIGRDPLLAQTGSQLDQFMYMDLVRARLKPKWRLYKRKGLVVRGSPYPHRELWVEIPGLGTIEPATVDEEGDWEVTIQSELSVGSYPVHLHLVDVAGRPVLVPNALMIDIDKSYRPGQPQHRVAKPKLDRHGWLWSRYKHVYASGSLVALVEEPETRQQLKKHAWQPTPKTSPKNILEIELIVISSLVLGALRFLRV